MINVRHLLFGLIVALAAQIAGLTSAVALAGESGIAGTASRPHYSIEAQLDFPSGALTAVQTVVIRNGTDETVSELVFNITAARDGAIEIGSASIDGIPITATRTGVVLSLPLPAPLEPGQTIAVKLGFAGKVPSPGDLRFGRANSVVALGNWYPVLSLYRPGQGWDRHHYVATGDAFTTDVADYDLSLVVTGTAGDVTVASSGALVDQQNNAFRVRAENLRDFALSVSTRYATAVATVDGTRITAHFLPEHAVGGELYLRAAAESFRWYSQVLGSYPYQQLTIAETTGNDMGWIGQEYPGILLIGSTTTGAAGSMADYFSYLIAHEVAHQWFYALVGNNQVYEPWLDEAFATYLGYQYLRSTNPTAYASRWQAQTDRFRSAAVGSGYRPVNSSIYDFADENHYYAMVYSQGALFLDELRQTMGDSAFWQLLRRFVDQYRFKIAPGHSFLRMAEQQTGRDLRPLFARYFTSDLFASAADYPVPNGHFYSQANGQAGGGYGEGYSVTDDGGVGFWGTFRRLGGVEAVGYPISRRFVWDGFLSQAFQKAVFQWHPEGRSVSMVNVFDQISLQGQDGWLEAFRATPPIADWASDKGRTWADVVRRHQQLLDANPSIKARYFALQDPVNVYGLPMAPIADVGDAFVVRMQRAAIQQWKVDVPWAKAGQVTVANGGDIAKEAGLIPAAALRPEEAPD